MIDKVRNGGLFNAMKSLGSFGKHKKAVGAGGNGGGVGGEGDTGRGGLDTVRRYKRVLYPSLNEFLRGHKLLRYEPVLVKNGFDTVEALVLVKERDIDELGLLLGHKRKLQCALKEFRSRRL
jgi:hypothetical protein